MTVRDLTMTTEQVKLLKKECNATGPRESACQMLCGVNVVSIDPWQREKPSELRLTVHHIDPIPDHLKTTSDAHVSWDMDCYIKLLRKARTDELHPGICHSHPRSNSTFSEQDDKNESHLRNILQRRNSNQVLTSVLFRGDGKIEARVWSKDGSPKKISVRVLGNTLQEFNSSHSFSNPKLASNFLHRQCLVVGEETVARLQRLRVAIVGCGGTGSAVAVLLVRAGVRRILLIDPDIVDETNLNRVHGSTRRDVVQKRLKVHVLKDHLESMGLGVNVEVVSDHLATANVARLLCSCDCIFGCTDDNLGRLILNRLAYFYFIPVIDTGLAVEPRKSARIAQITGRVTSLRPGVPCLLCRNTIDPTRAREKSLLLNRPEEYERQRKAGYINDDNTPTPVVGTFTTETGAAAVNEFLAGFAGLRGRKGWTKERTIRYDLDRCRPTGCKSRSDCPVCSSQKFWGLGDVEPFLDISGM